MGAGRIGFVHVPSKYVSSQEVGVWNSGYASIELEMTRGNVSPTGVILVILIEFAAQLDGVPAADESEHVSYVIDALAEHGVDIAVAARAGQPLAILPGAQPHGTGPGSGVDGNVRKHVGGGIGAIDGLQA